MYYKMKHTIVLVSIFLSVGSLYGQSLKSRVLNDRDGTPIEFVSIGIKDHSYGTLTNDQGNFDLKIANLNEVIGDTLRISSVGFKTVEYVISQDIDLPNEIHLQEDIIHLDEVAVSIKQNSRVVSKGTTSTSKRVVTGWSGYGRGGERGIKISLGKDMARIKGIRFYLAENKYDSVQFRLHIRKLVNGIPKDNLLEKNVFAVASKSHGWVSFDLNSISSTFAGDVCVSVEVIRVWGNCNQGNCLLLSASPIKGTLYAKEGSEGKWIVKRRFSPSIVADLIYVR